MKKKIFVTRRFAENGIQLLKNAGHEVSIFEKDEIISHRELLKRVKGCDALLSLLTDKIDREIFDAAGPALKIVSNFAVGFDNIDLLEAKKRGIVVTNTPSDIVNEAVAEHTFALMLALGRRIVEADTFTRAKKYTGWSPTHFLGMKFKEKTLGIIGAGRIGASTARRATLGLGMHVLYTDSRKNTDLEHEIDAKRVSMEKLLESSDVISLHVPLLPSTHHLISTNEFSLFKKSAYLINTARGPVVDEKALLRALRTKRIAGAALDVFEAEPAIDCDVTDQLELRKFPNVILTPHIASATIEAREDMSRIAAENILAVLAGKAPINSAN